MSSKPISPILRGWYNWKALRLPWRKRFLVGLDLHGNTFWEFRDTRGDGPGRLRRIVKYPRSIHYGDVKVSPQWHQWLRHTREHPPSLQEQRQDVFRQEQMKMLAAEADARWEAKPSLIDVPGQERVQPMPSLNTETDASLHPIPPAKAQESVKSGKVVGSEPVMDGSKSSEAKKDDPWKRARGGLSEEWQPQAWDPSSTTKQ